MSSVQCKALYPHKAARADLLSFNAGDVLTLLDRSHPDWWLAQLGTQTGRIPAKYVQIIETAPVPSSEGIVGKGVALYDCTPPRADVLGFKKGDVIVLLSVSSEDWFVGECEGRTGLVAKNYIRMLPADAARRTGGTMGRDGERPVSTASQPSPPVGQRKDAGAGAVPGAVQRQSTINTGIARPTAPAGAAVPDQKSPRTNTQSKPPPPQMQVPQAAGAGASSVSPRPNSTSGSSGTIQGVRPLQPAVPANAPQYRAKADYLANKPNILNIRKGDVIRVVDQSRQDWWRGELNGVIGAVPASYLEPVAAVAAVATLSPDEAAERKARRSTIVAAPDVAAKMRAAAEAAKASTKTGVGLYNFTQAKPGVLLFKKGDVLTILDDSRPDWWKASLDGKVGMVPAKYIELKKNDAPVAVATAAAAAPTGAVKAAGAQPVPAAGAAAAAAAPADVVHLVATQAYKSPRPDILGLEPGMQMELLHKASPDWWRVRMKANGKVGLVPVKFVQVVAGPRSAPNAAAPAVPAAAETTIRTQKAQQMAAASVGAAMGAGANNPVAALAGALQGGAKWEPQPGEVVEGQVGAAWIKVTIVEPLGGGNYSATKEDGAPVTVTKVRKLHKVSPVAADAAASAAAAATTDWKANLKKSPRPSSADVGDASAPAPTQPSPAQPPVKETAAAKAGPKKGNPKEAGAAVAAVPPKPTPEPVAESKPAVVAEPVAPPTVAPAAVPPPMVLPPPPSVLPPPPVGTLPTNLPPPPAVLPPPPSVLPPPQQPSMAAPTTVAPAAPTQSRQDDSFEEARLEAKRRAELALDAALVLPVGLSVADLDRTIAEAAMESVQGRWKDGDSVEARYGATEWFAASVVGTAKRDPSNGAIFYSVRYEDYGNIVLVPEADVREQEAAPEVAELGGAENMKFEVGAMVEAQYVEDLEWYVARVDAYTPDGRYSVTFLEYGNHQDCAPEAVRELTVPLEEVLPLLEVKTPTNLKYHVDENVLAQYVDDGLWYAAQIKGITPNGTYWVSFVDYGNEQECAEAQILPYKK